MAYNPTLENSSDQTLPSGCYPPHKRVQAPGAVRGQRHRASQKIYFLNKRKGKVFRFHVETSTFTLLELYASAFCDGTGDDRMSQATQGLEAFLAHPNLKAWLGGFMAQHPPAKAQEVKGRQNRRSELSRDIRAICALNRNPLNHATLLALTNYALRGYQLQMPQPTLTRELHLPIGLRAQLIQIALEANAKGAAGFVASSRGLPALGRVVDWLVATKAFSNELARAKAADTERQTAAPDSHQIP